MRGNSLKFLLIGLTVYLIFSSLPPASMQTQSHASADHRIAIVSAVKGKVFVHRSGMYASRPVQVSDAFSWGDSLQVDEESEASLEFQDESVMRIVQNTKVTFRETRKKYTNRFSTWQLRRLMIGG